MKSIGEYLIQHLREHPSWLFLSGWAAFLVLSLYVRYGLGWHPWFWGWSYRGLWGLGFYALPYFFTVIWYTYCYSKPEIWGQWGFWVVSVGILWVLWANQYGLFYKPYKSLLPFQLGYFYEQVSFNVHSAFFYLLIPLAAWWAIPALRQTQFFGCTTEGFHWQVYGILLLAMMPLLWWASFRPDFLDTYPRYQAGLAEAYWRVSPALTVGGYELSYALQFVALEIFFRGFMVFALGLYLGSGAVFPMVSVYCFLHFFKPLPETIGSIFGGYILGVIAHYSRSTLGGMMVHIGIAWAMELLAWGQMSRR